MPIRRWLLGLLLLVLPTMVRAQEVASAPARNPHPRDGFFASVGLGLGKVSFNEDASEVDDMSGISAIGRFGGTLDPRWRLGGEVLLWRKEIEGIDVSLNHLLATVLFYPDEREGFFLKGGLGIGGYKEQYQGWKVTAGGGAMSLGIGYDAQFANGNGITTTISWVGSSSWDIQVSSTGGSGTGTGLYADPTFLQVGVAYTWN